MSRSQKLLIILGSLIIMAVMTIGAFSMGMYVGERGRSAEPPSITGAGKAQPPQGRQATPDKQPPAVRELLPKGKPDLVGVVQSVARRSVTIKTGEGPRLVLVSDQTRFEWHDDRKATLADLRPNVGVAVFGDFDGAGRTLTASVIVILPPKT